MLPRPRRRLTVGTLAGGESSVLVEDGERSSASAARRVGSPLASAKDPWTRPVAREQRQRMRRGTRRNSFRPSSHGRPNSLHPSGSDAPPWTLRRLASLPVAGASIHRRRGRRALLLREVAVGACSRSNRLALSARTKPDQRTSVYPASSTAASISATATRFSS